VTISIRPPYCQAGEHSTYAMAHIFSLANPASSAYREGSRWGDQVKFPDSGFFQGFNKPSRLEADIFELETTGIVSMSSCRDKARSSVISDTQRYKRNFFPYTARPSLPTLIRGGHTLQRRWFGFSIPFRERSRRLQTAICTHRSVQSGNEGAQVSTWSIQKPIYR